MRPPTKSPDVTSPTTAVAQIRDAMGEGIRSAAARVRKYVEKLVEESAVALDTEVIYNDTEIDTGRAVIWVGGCAWEDYHLLPYGTDACKMPESLRKLGKLQQSLTELWYTDKIYICIGNIQSEAGYYD